MGPTTGDLAWKRELEGAVVPGPAVAPDGTIYAASNGGVLHAFDLDGEELWHFDGGSPYGGDLSTTPAITSEGTISGPVREPCSRSLPTGICSGSRSSTRRCSRRYWPTTGGGRSTSWR